MKDAGVQFYEGIPTTSHLQKWFPKGGLLVLDDLMTDGGEDKELLDLSTKHSHHLIIIKELKPTLNKQSDSILVKLFL